MGSERGRNRGQNGGVIGAQCGQRSECSHSVGVIGSQFGHNECIMRTCYGCIAIINASVSLEAKFLESKCDIT